MALTSEVPPGSSWDGPLVSQMTGGDPVKANHMWMEHQVFTPQFRLVVLCNDLPLIPTAESGINRRARVMPMNQIFADEKNAGDTTIARYFTRGDGRGQVLRWIADGAKRLAHVEEKDRYPSCEVIEQATRAYVHNVNDMETWVGQHLVVDPDGWLPRRELHDAYIAWARAGGKRLYSAALFLQRLRPLLPQAVESMRTGTRGFIGYRLGG